MRVYGILATGLGAVLLMAASACASTVPGDGRVAVGERAGSERPADTTRPTEGTDPSRTGAPTDDGTGTLECPGPSVSPAGAPYCYTAPTGLPEVELGDPTAGHEGSFRTSYGFGPTDHIDVQAYIVGIDTDELADAEIIAELDEVILELERGGFDFDEEPASLLIDGARGFAYRGTSTDRSQAIVANFVFRGLNEVQINCASIDRADVIDAACLDVLGSLQIVS